MNIHSLKCKSVNNFWKTFHSTETENANVNEDEHEENVLWRSKTAEEWYKFPKVQDDL